MATRGLSRLLFGVIGALLVAEGAAASDTAVGGTDITIEDDAVIVDAAHPGSLGLTDSPGSPYDGPRLSCGYFELVLGGPTEIDVVLVAPEIGETYLWFCWRPGDHPILEPYSATYPVVLVYSPSDPPGGEVITAPVAARYATDRIDFPPTTVALSPAGRQVVGVPTWLAVTSRLDHDPVSAAAGPVWATVRPEFRSVEWQLGDGTTVVCTDDATTRWRADRGATQRSDCTHTFESSIDAPFAGTATVSWTIWQRTNEHPTEWTFFDVVSVSTPVEFAVTELEAAIN